jgi:hypothetical protein
MKALGKGSVASIIGIGLRIAWILLWIGAAGLLVAIAAYAGLQLAAASGAIEPELLSSGDRRMEMVWRFGSVHIDFDEPEVFAWPYAVPGFLAGIVIVGGGLVIVWRLMRIFRNFASGETFSADNAGHLRIIWIALLTIEISRYAIAALMHLLLLALGPPTNLEVSISPPVSLSSWAAILVLIVLAEVFREGARLREDQKLTI